MCCILHLGLLVLIVSDSLLHDEFAKFIILLFTDVVYFFSLKLACKHAKVLDIHEQLRIFFCFLKFLLFSPLDLLRLLNHLFDQGIKEDPLGIPLVLSFLILLQVLLINFI